MGGVQNVEKAVAKEETASFTALIIGLSSHNTTVSCEQVSDNIYRHIISKVCVFFSVSMNQRFSSNRKQRILHQKEIFFQMIQLLSCFNICVF